MNKKINGVMVAKIAGWLICAAGGILTSWAVDKETKKQNDENFEKYIENQKKGNQ